MVFLKIYTILIIPVFILYTAGIALAGWSFGLLGLISVFFVNVIPTMSVHWICEKAGSVSAKLYTGYSGRTIREQYSGHITQARYLKSRKEFAKALELIEQYLAKDPDYSEAIYLKAQILLEGFNDRIGAQKCVDTIVKGNNLESDCWVRWAMSMQNEIAKKFA